MKVSDVMEASMHEQHDEEDALWTNMTEKETKAIPA